MKRKIFILIIFSLLFLNNIYSLDLIINKDGTVLLGKIISYKENEPIQFKKKDGSIINYENSTILAIRTNIDIDNIITQSLSPTYNMIKYYPRNNDESYEISPRYTYKGQTYNMESKIGRQTQILEFFDMLEKNNTLDKNTKILINELKSKLKKTSNIIKASAITQFSGISLLLFPYFFMDDSTNPVTFQEWTAIPAIAGLSLDIIGLGLLISQLTFNQDKLLEQIAISFNNNL